MGRRSRACGRDQCLDRHRARRHGDHPLRPGRDGPGQLHRAADDRRRGTRMRLGQGEGGIRLGQSEFPREAGLRPARYGRQPRRAGNARHAAAGGRQRARAADRRRRQALGRRAVRMLRRSEQGDAQGVGPDVALRRARRRGGADQARQGAHHQDARPVQADGQADGAARYAAQDQRQCRLRHRHRGAGHGEGRDHGLPGVRRPAAQRRRVRRSPDAAASCKW